MIKQIKYQNEYFHKWLILTAVFFTIFLGVFSTSPLSLSAQSQDIVTIKSAILPVATSYISCAQDPSTNKIYCFGGNTSGGNTNRITEYDPQTDTMVTKSAVLPVSTTVSNCSEDSSTRKIYCFGGGTSSGLTNRITEYNPQTDTIVTKSAVLPTGTRSLGCAEDSSTHKIYCFGGEVSASGNLTNRITEYNPQTDTMVTKSAVLPVAKVVRHCAEDSSTYKIYCLGGRDSSNQALNEIIEYNPQTDITITKSAVLPTGTRSLDCAENSLTHKIYCFGGKDNSNTLDQIIEYDPQTNIAMARPVVLPTEKATLSCAENSSTHKIYCFGGETSSGSRSNQVIEYSQIISSSPAPVNLAVDPGPCNKMEISWDRMTGSISSTPLTFTTGTLIFNPQVGLSEQDIIVTNNTGASVPGVRVTVESLNVGSVYNQMGTDANGKNFIQHNYPVADGGSVTLRVAHYNPTGTTPVLTYSAQAVNTLSEPAVPGGAVLGSFQAAPVLDGNGHTILRWDYTSGKDFAIQYSDDSGATWRTAFGNGSSAAVWVSGGSPAGYAWRDYGPGQTRSDPTVSRQYRLYSFNTGASSTQPASAVYGSSTVTGYKLYRTPATPATNASPVTIPQPASGSVVTFEDAGLSTGGLYGYQVSAIYGTGEGDKSDSQSDYTLTQAQCVQGSPQVNLNCFGLQENRPACTAEYNGSVDLRPQGFSASSCTPSSSNSAHSGWNSATWLVSQSIGGGYYNFKALDNRYMADGLNQKEYIFTLSCRRDSNPPLSVSEKVCVKPPPVTITGEAIDSSTIRVTWNKPAIHTSFGLYYKLNIDRTGTLRVVDIGNTDTTFGGGNGTCDSIYRPGAPYGQCKYTDTGLTSGSLHNYQLQVFVDYNPPCDPTSAHPISTLSSDPSSETNVITPACEIVLGINGSPGVSSFEWNNANPITINWSTKYIASGNNCQVVGSNIDGFSGTAVDCSSASAHSQTITSSLPNGTYDTYLKFGTNCQSSLIRLVKTSAITDFSLSANPPVIELVAVGSPVGKNIKSTKSTITITKASGFNEAVTLLPGNVKVNGTVVDKSKFYFNLVPLDATHSTLQVSSLSTGNPILDGTYEIVVNGTSPSVPDPHSTSVTLKVRTVSPGFIEY